MSEPVTREELTAVLAAALVASESRTAGKLKQMETRLLKEFYKWARPTAIYIRQHGENIRPDELLAMIEERLQELESK